MSYKIRVTTTVQQIGHDGRVLFSVTDSVDESSINDARNQVDVPAGFLRGMAALSERLASVLQKRYEQIHRPPG